MNKKTNTAKIAALAVFSLVLLAGCRELPGKEASSTNNQLEQHLSSDTMTEIEQDLSESAAELKQGIGEALDNVQQAVQNTASAAAEHFTADSVTKELTASIAAGSSSTLSLDHAVGEIEMLSTEDSNISVEAVIVVHNSFSSKHTSELFDHAEVDIKQSGDTLKISTHAKGSKKDLWSWAQKKYGSSDFSINYVIQLPSTVENFRIHNDVGTIQIRDLRGTFDIDSDVGAISLQNVEVIGKSTVKTDTGSIGLEISEMKSGSSLKAKSDIGMITASLGSDLKCTVSASSELGSITGTSAGKQDFNGGGPLLSLSTEIGAISVKN